MTSFDELVEPCGSTCGIMLKPSACPPRYHCSSASAMSAAVPSRDAVPRAVAPADRAGGSGSPPRAMSITTFWRPCWVLVRGTSGTGPSSGYFARSSADDVGQQGDAKLGLDQRLQPVEFFLRFFAVSPTTVSTPGMILIESGARPHSCGARLQLGIEFSGRRASADTVNSTSAVRAASRDLRRDCRPARSPAGPAASAAPSGDRAPGSACPCDEACEACQGGRTGHHPCPGHGRHPPTVPEPLRHLR